MSQRCRRPPLRPAAESGRVEAISGRSSTTTTRKPSSVASRDTACPTWPAPAISSVGGTSRWMRYVSGLPSCETRIGNRRGLSPLGTGDRIAVRRSVGPRVQHRNADCHPAAADQAVVPAVVVIEVELQQRRIARAEFFERTAADLRLDAPAAERAERAGIRAHKHRRPGDLRRRAAVRRTAQQRGSPAASLGEKGTQNGQGFTHGGSLVLA